MVPRDGRMVIHIDALIEASRYWPWALGLRSRIPAPANGTDNYDLAVCRTSFFMAS